LILSQEIEYKSWVEKNLSTLYNTLWHPYQSIGIQLTEKEKEEQLVKSRFRRLCMIRKQESHDCHIGDIKVSILPVISMDKRHLRRIKTVQKLFALSFSEKNDTDERTTEILEHSTDFDAYIQQYAQKYSVEKIAKVDVAILRLAIFELLIEKKVPPKVIINEAVELGKELGGEKSPGFINAVLGKIYEANIQNTEQ